MSATITPFVFEDPTYIVKAVYDNMKSPQAGWYWPESGSVDDSKNWVPTQMCGGGLYGYTIDHLMDNDPVGGSYFDCPHGKNDKRFLILEVERSEIVHDGKNKCKVPRCNVVGCYEADEWQVMCAKWSHLLGDSPPVSEIINKMMIWIGRMELTDDLREELREWSRKTERYLPGDGCITTAEREVFQYLRDGDWLESKPQENKVLISQIAFFIQTTSCQAARMFIWAKLQKNVEWLFAVHPHIEKIMVACAYGNLDKVSSHPIRDWSRESVRHYIENHLHKFSKEDQKEIRKILSTRE